ncbi:MAG: fumarylacetoacetate hydrolase family protein [Candidatus Thermoplasmatota archaeon]
MAFYRIKGSKRRIKIGKIICLIRTYKDHAYEMGAKTPDKPLFFLKPDTTIILSGDSIRLPPTSLSSCIHHEVELGVVISDTAYNIRENDAEKYILGYLVALDITARDIQNELKKQGLPWDVAKSFDTFAPISDVVLKEHIPNPNNIEILLKINHIIKQRVNTSDMIFPVQYIISYISRIMTLKRGDLILTGTPQGVGEIHEGDIIEAYLGNHCSLKIDVRR